MNLACLRSGCSSPDCNPTLSSSMVDLCEPIAEQQSPQFFPSVTFLKEENEDGDEMDAIRPLIGHSSDELKRMTINKPIKKKKPHLKGRFSGRLETLEDQKRLPEECRALGPLLGGSEHRGENDCRTLAKIVRAIAKGDVRRHCETREMKLRDLQRQVAQIQKGMQGQTCMCGASALREENGKLKLKIQQMNQLLNQFMSGSQQDIPFIQPSTSSISASSGIVLAPQLSTTNLPSNFVAVAPDIPPQQPPQQQQSLPTPMQIMQVQALATVQEQTSQQKLVNAAQLEGQVEELKSEVTQKKDQLLEAQLEQPNCPIVQQEAAVISDKMYAINKLSHVAQQQHQEAKTLAIAAQNNKQLVQRLVNSQSVSPIPSPVVSTQIPTQTPVAALHPVNPINTVESQKIRDMGLVQPIGNQNSPLSMNTAQGIIVDQFSRQVNVSSGLPMEQDIQLNDLVGEDSAIDGAIDVLLRRPTI
eukprot:TRINITY_DN22988_c0_g1_i4.p1 TRINITY_DN22988_c0_g1~~TRINITY_DN22988_c0_g1_i4.p1  ORF type:complete len:473 (+),score=57.12 TRINITY_DN22988_c0_g1_i4:270-1688(+)